MDDTHEESMESKSRELLEAYRQMLTSLFLATVTLIGLIAVPLVAISIANRTAPRYDLPILAYVALAGALGGFFSALMRLYSLEQLPAALLHVDLRRLRNRYLFMYSLIPPITGMIGAVVFYIVVAAGLRQADLFQHFKCAKGEANCNSFAGLLDYAPREAADYAKSLIWGFIAGVSERLVPDALGRLAKNSQIT